MVGGRIGRVMEHRRAEIRGKDGSVTMGEGRVSELD
jgi:hypothetical protein